ncbi:hypothetical protein K466DRAFT_660366 [Polyporus arcularius HHB13444]|uniref:Fungal-type protein kinase domain-containing protein n=1 Tax=Polyporus arcularius HHB13444 TaxID=1314778 RepID=A0A5C3PNX8_9APHY|nr:hypothetical protein K466DRAFT_660366 [Polyporus arcularius HHB13444]
MTLPHLKALVLKGTDALEWAKERGSRPEDGANSAMPKHVFDAIVEHLRTHVPTQSVCPSSMLLNIIMLRITCILSKPERTVLFIPERSVLVAAANYSGEPPMRDVVHHMLIRAGPRSASIIVSDPVGVLDSSTRWINKIHITHIFEAKSQYGFDHALPYAVQEIAEWCGRTGRRFGKGIITYSCLDIWRFISYDAAGEDGRGLSRVTGKSQIMLEVDKVDTILGLVLDMVENASEENLQFFDKPASNDVSLLLELFALQSQLQDESNSRMNPYYNQHNRPAANK